MADQGTEKPQLVGHMAWLEKGSSEMRYLIQPNLASVWISVLKPLFGSLKPKFGFSTAQSQLK